MVGLFPSSTLASRLPFFTVFHPIPHRYSTVYQPFMSVFHRFHRFEFFGGEIFFSAGKPREKRQFAAMQRKSVGKHREATACCASEGRVFARALLTVAPRRTNKCTSSIAWKT
jgi:hypothetical protein